MTRRATLLDADTVTRLRAAQPTYDAVGASLDGTVPDGYHRLHRIGPLDVPFAVAREALFGWQVQLRSGIRVRASSPGVTPDAVGEVSLGVGPFRMTAPVRVVAVIDGPREAAFAYGTLPGHPESGEECFRVSVDDDGLVRFTLDGFSKPGTVVTRTGAPIAAMVQSRITDRYLRSLRDGQGRGPGLRRRSTA